MQKRGWVGGDPLYADVKAAQDALHRLRCTLREVGKVPPRDESGPAAVGAGRRGPGGAVE